MKTKIIFFTIVALIALAGITRILQTYKTGSQSVVIVSIPPLYMIAKDVMNGTTSPHLLIKEKTSPHDFSLKPSEAKLIGSAKVIFWVGKGLEHGLHSSINRVSPPVEVVSFLKHTKIKTHQLKEEESHAGHDHGLVDPHIWLDPDNAIEIAKSMRDTLMKVDPKNRTLYAKNTTKLISRIQKATKTLKEQLTPYQSTSFAVFHNAYQYFQKAFGLKTPQSLTLNPEQSLKIKRLKDLEETIQKGEVKCLFTEPQFPQKIIETISTKTKVNVATLDPLGSEKISYVELLERLGQNIIKCHQIKAAE